MGRRTFLCVTESVPVCNASDGAAAAGELVRAAARRVRSGVYAVVDRQRTSNSEKVYGRDQNAYCSANGPFKLSLVSPYACHLAHAVNSSDYKAGYFLRDCARWLCFEVVERKIRRGWFCGFNRAAKQPRRAFVVASYIYDQQRYVRRAFCLCRHDDSPRHRINR